MIKRFEDVIIHTNDSNPNLNTATNIIYGTTKTVTTELRIISESLTFLLLIKKDNANPMNGLIRQNTIRTFITNGAEFVPCGT